jgi:hypothetical protein
VRPETKRALETQTRHKQDDPLKRQKRPTIEAKETYYRGKTNLSWRADRDVNKVLRIETKETYYRGKRDLL